VYGGILDSLEALREQGISLAVLSNKPDFAVREVVSRFLPDIFSYVGGAKDGVPLKPRPDSLIAILSELGFYSDEAVYVGDSEVDVETARNANMPCISVSWGFRTAELAQNPLYDAHVDDTTNINIVCGYADLDGDVNSTLCPISRTDLKTFGADYYALGSRHEATELTGLGGSMYSYCGALECMGFDEPGLGGAKLLNVKYADGELAVDGKNMTFGHIRFVNEVVDITAVNTTSEIINRISRMISDKKYGIETAIRCILVGQVDPTFVIPTSLENDVFGLYCFELCDRTSPLYGTESLRRDMSMKGELFRTLLPHLEGDDEEQRLVAARALREGLAALENRNVD
jgi:hypothetical protein